MSRARPPSYDGGSLVSPQSFATTAFFWVLVGERGQNDGLTLTKLKTRFFVEVAEISKSSLWSFFLVNASVTHFHFTLARSIRE